MKQPDTETYGKPDIKVCGLQIWIHSRQFDESNDFWDGNWLNITAHCGDDGASVWTSGSILHLSEIKQWQSELDALNRSIEGKASMRCIEPHLAIEICLGPRGSGKARIEITNDNMSQGHWFENHFDQSYLRELLRDLDDLFARYPIRGKP